jgi:DNA-binding HxlR family transcriptional regulator
LDDVRRERRVCLRSPIVKYAPFGTYMPSKRANPYSPLCPSRKILELIGSKWSMLVLCTLRIGAVRTGALRREVGGISQKMLTQTLRDLERHGLIERISYDEIPPRVEYRLTRLGRSLSDLIEGIENWVASHYPRLIDEVRVFDARERA